MKTLVTTLVIAFLSASLVWAQTIAPKKVITPVRADKSSALRDIDKSKIPTEKKAPSVEIPIKSSPLEDKIRTGGGTKSLGADPAWQQSQGVLNILTTQNFEGLSDEDNENIIGFLVAPPDPNGDVGPNHYVQMINLLFAVYDKTGNTLLGPLPNNALWAGFGGSCEFDNNGDPIVLYDHLADRWLLTQIAISSGLSVCIACSETPDPTGAYFRYEFPFDNFLDYPKFGVWPDAYYATFRSFGDIFDMVAAALEREKILVGDPSAQIVLFSISDALAPTIIDGVLPVDLDGPPPPAGTPGIFLGHQDDAFTGAPEDRLVMFELSVDWDNPANSTFDGPSFLPTDPFDIDVFGVPQPAPGGLLDALPAFMMYRLAFRNFGTHMAMVTNHTVDVGDFNDHAGIRWYELRNEGSGWNIFQQGTYSPNADHRWMGSMAMDGQGNMALGYSVSGNFTFPSIRYTGRTADAPPGEMNIAEQSIIEGSGAQLESFRWGDYTMMTIDPTDDATFWYTNEYYAETSAFNFRTRIGAFDLEPLPGPQIHILPPNINFGVMFLGEPTDSITVTINNIGDKDLTVKNISDPGPDFTLIDVPALPVTIPSFGSVTFAVAFTPTMAGEISAVMSISSNDKDNPVVEVALEGEVIDLTMTDAIIWNPTGLMTSQEVIAQAAKTRERQITEQKAQALLDTQAPSSHEIAAALDANKISNIILSNPSLPPSIPPNIKYLFVVLGQPPTNFIIFDGTPEAITIEDFIANGGHVYMEGADVWFFDPNVVGGHNFNPTFGIEPVDDGAGGGELVHIVGSSIAEGQDFDYIVGTDNFPDHIDPTGTGFLVHTNISDFSTFNCGVANPFGASDSLSRGRTIGVSFEFGQLIDGDSSSTKTALMASYLDFFDNGFALEGPQIIVKPDSIGFVALVGDTSQAVTITIQNIGSEDLIITDIADPGAPFVLMDLPVLPLLLPSGGSDTFAVAFAPTMVGEVSAAISIGSNDADDPEVQVTLHGEDIAPPAPGTLFASTGQNNSLITIDPVTGIGTFVGLTDGFGQVTEIEFREDGTLFGSTGGGNSGIITIDIITGDPTLVGIHDFGSVNGLEFDAAGTLFGTYISSPGEPSQLVTVNTETAALTYIGPTGFSAIGGLAFAPDGTLYGVTAGSGGGNLITLDTATGVGTLVGPTGFNDVAALEFGPDRLLYGGTGGNDFDAGSLIIIDPKTGAGAFVGATGFPVISGLSFFPQDFESKIIADVICSPQLFQTCPVSIDIQIDISGSSESEQLGSFTGTLTWDPSLLEYTGDSGIQSGFTGIVNAENADSGKLVFNGANPSGAGGEIPILTVEFNVIGPLAESGMIDLEFTSMAASSTFVDLLPDLAVNDCSFTIDTSPFLLGDLNGDKVVNSADALICLSYDAGFPIPVEFEERIKAGLGDVNGDMVTNATDCLIILTFDVGIPVPYPIGEPVCPKENIPLASLPTARKIVSLHGGNTIRATAQPTTSKITHGNRLEIPVVVNMAELRESLGSYTATLTWDPAVLHFEGFSGGTTMGFENPLVNTAEVKDGKLTFAHAHAHDTKGSINLLNVKFKAIGESGSSSAMDLSFQSLTTGSTFYDLLPLLKADDPRVASKVVIIPDAFALGQNYPNPFNPVTEINYQLPEVAWVDIAVYNLSGRKVRILVNREEQAGNYTIAWDGKDDRGGTVRSGTYVLKMVSGDFVTERKMVFVKE